MINNLTAGQKTELSCAEETIRTWYSVKEKLDREDKPHFLTKTSVSLGEALELAKIVVSERAEHTLEVGLAIGASAIAIASAKRAADLLVPHVALDPFQEQLCGGVGLLEIERAGLSDAVVWRNQHSEKVFIEGRTLTARYDFIFIDGGHSIGQAVTDTFLGHDLLNSGGVLAIHDALLFSTMASVRHLVKERGYTVLRLNPDSAAKRILRSFRYAGEFGLWYATQVIPRTHRSLVALRRP